MRGSSRQSLQPEPRPAPPAHERRTDTIPAALADLLRGWLGDRLELCVADEGPLDLPKK